MSAPTIFQDQRDLQQDDGHLDNPEGWLARRFVFFLQCVFNCFPPGQYHWSPDEKETEITITDQVPIPAESIDQRTTIQLVVGGTQNQNLAMGHLLSMDWRTGRKEFVDLFTGQASFNVHARNDDPAKNVAQIVADAILQARQLLMRIARLQFIGFAVTVGPTSPPGALVNAGAEVESTMVSVMFPFYMAKHWISEPKMVPLGEADAYFRGLKPKVGTAPEDPSTVRQILVDTRLLLPGVISRDEQELSKLVRSPISPPTIHGRTLQVVRQLDQINEDLQPSPRVKALAVSDREE